MLKLAAALLLLSASAAHADVVIGVAGPLTGPYQTFGQAMVNGVKAAVDKINSEGGINREQLIVVTADDQCDAVKARDAADKLLAAQVDVVIGHFCSNPALESAKIYDKAGVAMIAPTATLATLTEAGLSNVIRLSSRSDAQGAFAANRILAKRPNAKLLLVDDATSEMKAIITNFNAAYGKPPALAATLAPDQKDFAELIAKAKTAGIDTLYTATSAADAGRFSVHLAKAGLDLKRYGPDSLLGEAYWTTAGAAGENTLVSFPIDPESSNEAKALSRDLKALGQAPEGPFLMAYAGVQLFAAAALDQGSHAGTKIAAEIKSGKAFPTILGQLKFDSKGDGQDLRFNWYSWNNGVYQTIAPEN